MINLKLWQDHNWMPWGGGINKEFCHNSKRFFGHCPRKNCTVKVLKSQGQVHSVIGDVFDYMPILGASDMGVSIGRWSRCFTRVFQYDSFQL